MAQPPALPGNQRVIDNEHLRLLAIFHFIAAGLAFVAIGFLALHFTLFKVMMNHAGSLKNAQNSGAPMPTEIFAIFQWFYLLMAVFLIFGAVGNLYAGFFIRARKHRVFTLVVSGYNLFHIPFGTALGVFTIIVLARDSVTELYEDRAG